MTLFRRALLRFLAPLLAAALAPAPARADEISDAYNQGSRYMNAGMYREAVPFFDRAIRLDPGHENAYLNRGIARRALGDYRAAIRDFSEAIRLDPRDRKGYLNRAISLFETGDYPRSIADYTVAIRLHTRDPAAFHGRGKVYFASRQYEKAIQNYTAAIRLNPRYAGAYHERGVARLHRSDHSGAILDFKQAILLDDNDPAAKWGAYFNRATTYFLLEKYDSAIFDAHRVLLAPQEARGLALPAILLVHFAHRYAGQETLAAGILYETERLTSDTAWPYPVVSYLRGEIPGEALLQSSDTGTLTQAHAYIGLDLSLAGRKSTALRLLRWVHDRGDMNYAEYLLAERELGRLAPTPSPPAAAIDTAVVSPRRSISSSVTQ